MSDLYLQFVDSEGYKIIQRELAEQLVAYRERLVGLANDKKLTSDPVAFTIEATDLAAKIKTIEYVLELPEQVLKDIEEEKKK
jgi:hypothetical protein